MEKENYTKGELLLMFGRLEEILNEIKADIKNNSNKTDQEIALIKLEVQKIKDWQNRLMAIWGAIVLALGFLGQKIFSIF